MFASSHTTLNCGGRLITLSKPCVMGILNITPDSFFDGGKYIQEDEILKQCSRMINEGALMIDVGGFSSRPGALIPDAETECNRVLPVIKLLSREFPDIIFSVDTFRSEVAMQAIDAGAHIINDITAGNGDKEMVKTIARLKVPYIIMHMQGMPATMQHNPHYENVVTEVLDFFVERVSTLRQLGVVDIIVDPGFGFGKTIEHNYRLLAGLPHFKMLDVPLLAGLSRKSMICKVLEASPQQALNGTSVLHTIALLNGALILRAHDVKEAMECIKLTNTYFENLNPEVRL